MKQRRYSTNTISKLLFTLLTGLMLSGCSSLFFYPREDMVLNPELFEIDYEEIKAQNGESTLYGWRLKSATKEHKGTVLFLHGNGGNISLQIFSCFWLPWYGYDVITFDYSGYGRSTGEPDIPTVHEDARAMMEWTVANTPTDENRIIFAQSLGGAIAITVLAQFPQKAAFSKLLVDSAFSSYKEVARDAYKSSWLTWPFSPFAALTSYEEYDPKRYIASLSPIPVIIIHGKADYIVQPLHAKILYNLAREPKTLWMIEGTGHIGAFYDKQSRAELVRIMEK